MNNENKINRKLLVIILALAILLVAVAGTVGFIHVKDHLAGDTNESGKVSEEVTDTETGNEIETDDETDTDTESETDVKTDPETDDVIGGVTGRVTWTLDSGVLTISGHGAMSSYYVASAPWYEYRSEIRTVIIEDGVISVGTYAFYNYDSLTSVILPSSVTSVGDYAFAYCTAMKNITLPDNVTSIGTHAFGSCVSLTKINIPKSVTTIGKSAFTDCQSLQKINVASGNKNYTSVDGVLFDKAMTTLMQYPLGNSKAQYNIPESVTSIETTAFISCLYLKSIEVSQGNKNYTSVDGVLFDKAMTTLIKYPCGKADADYIIPDGVTTIGTSAFNNCHNLTSITIPDGIMYVEYEVFIWCVSLTDIYFGGTVAQWAAMIPENMGIPEGTTVHCSDGDVLKHTKI
ncbi:MAG: leucine-rich repeat protein [Clostridia bacterium]|nr:leucine-rich repeat protein [Clostridia bacterium]